MDLSHYTGSAIERRRRQVYAGTERNVIEDYDELNVWPDALEQVILRCRFER